MVQRRTCLNSFNVLINTLFFLFNIDWWHARTKQGGQWEWWWIGWKGGRWDLPQPWKEACRHFIYDINLANYDFKNYVIKTVDIQGQKHENCAKQTV